MTGESEQSHLQLIPTVLFPGSKSPSGTEPAVKFIFRMDLEQEGYTEYLNRTLKVMKRDDMQIEFGGNNITATAMVWVKPESNIDDTSKFNLSTDCAYFDPNPRKIYPGRSNINTPTWTG